MSQKRNHKTYMMKANEDTAEIDNNVSEITNYAKLSRVKYRIDVRLQN